MKIAELNFSETKIGQMNVLELKGILFSIIEKAKNREQLIQVVLAVKDVVEDEEDETTFWSRYTPEQRVELEKAFDESYDISDGIPHEDMKKKHAKWLNR